MKPVPISRIVLDRFTAFRRLDLNFGRGINVLIGANGTGKTHLLKVIYSACDITRTEGSFTTKLLKVFLPYEDRIGRLVHRQRGRNSAVIQIYLGIKRLRLSFTSLSKFTAKISGKRKWQEERIECVYIPVKEMLAHAPGFRSLYSGRVIRFEEIYADIVDRAYLPILRGPAGSKRRVLLRLIEGSLEGKVVTRGEEFFLSNKQGNLEFSLLAEGHRKLALLWILIQNGSLLEGSILFLGRTRSEPQPAINGECSRNTLGAPIIGSASISHYS